MKKIRFEFNCTRDVPFYAHLCDQYLLKPDYDIAIGREENRYYLEAEGEQGKLEKLADEVANDFLLSVCLTKPDIKLVDDFRGSKTPLKNNNLISTNLGLEYCQHCQPKFADNQSAQFGEIDLACPCCQSHLRITDAEKSFSLEDVKALTAKLNSQGYIELPSPSNTLPIIVSFQPINNKVLNSSQQRQHLVICNPNNLNAHFSLTGSQILGLSSIEKPFISAKPIAKHPRLHNALYEICFAKSRLLLVLCEVLRQQGVDYLYIAHSDNPHFAMVNGQWCEVMSQLGTAPLLIPTTQTPLHDDAQTGPYIAKWQKNIISVIQEPIFNHQPLGQAPDNAATCALLAAHIRNKHAKNTAAIYLSDQYKSQIVTSDKQQKIELFFEFPELPDNGYEIVHQLSDSPQKILLEKFKAQYPEDYIQLLSLKLAAPCNNIQTLWAIVAIILGAETSKGDTKEAATQLTKTALCDFVIAKAMAHKGSNAPRIDFPLTKGEAARSLNWCKTLGSIISFRLAEEGYLEKLAFGLHDSFADYIANWIEHLDQNIGLKSIVLAGNEFSNPMLAERVALRLVKNFTLNTNPAMDLDGVNLAVGGLYLKQRRR
ncbi:NiFe hydrogenase [Shewanella pneumatophori]|uniref:NiFe hydrogenase n=1 Tax=Shewanella pneumatophori TaxID=314092 RepID=A0A9X2CCY3_9GAMM|nr:NiFe hydrogenase [Shewanella pneumatophori]MCL1137387.1 NiFe hydrogenase [Shewanella pneumatophori]